MKKSKERNSIDIYLNQRTGYVLVLRKNSLIQTHLRHVGQSVRVVHELSLIHFHFAKTRRQKMINEAFELKWAFDYLQRILNLFSILFSSAFRRYLLCRALCSGF